MKILLLPLLWTTLSFAQTNSDKVLEELQSFTQGIDTIKKERLENQNDEDPLPAPSSDDIDKKEELKKQSSIKDLKMLNEQYKKSQKYSEQLQILDLLIPKLPKDISLQLDQIQAQKKIYYYPHPTIKKKLELEKKLKKIINHHPRHPEAYWSLFDLNDFYIKWSQNTEFYSKDYALQNLEFIKVIGEKFGGDRKTFKYLCQYLVINHLYDEAPPICQKAKKLNSQDPETLIYAEYLLKKQDQKSLLKILKKFPQSVEAHLLTGDLFFSQKKYGLSYKYFKKTLSFEPQNVRALIGAGESLFYKDTPKKALPYYTKACDLSVLKTRNLFQKAKSILNQKNLFDIAGRYQYQLDRCVKGISN